MYRLFLSLITCLPTLLNSYSFPEQDIIYQINLPEIVVEYSKPIVNNNYGLTPYEIALNKYGQEFIDSTHSIEKELYFPHGTLMSIFYSESKVSHDRVASNGATGLIMFMPSTMKSRGLTSKDLISMTAIEQLQLVKDFYLRWINRGLRVNSPREIYLLTFYPAAIGKPLNFVLGSQVGPSEVKKVAIKNSGIDLNKDQQITVNEFYEYLSTKSRLKNTIFQ